MTETGVDIDLVRAVFGERCEQRRWVAWREEPHKVTGKPTKIPYSPVQKGWAKSNDPETWGTLDDALHAYRVAQMHGVGIMFDPRIDDLGGEDLDSCRDPETGAIADWAQQQVDAFRTYTEVSPSGTGLKLYATAAPAELPANKIPIDAPPMNGKPAAIEAYVTLRWFAVTGQIISGVPDEVVEAGDAWDLLAADLRKRGENNEHGERIVGAATGATDMSDNLRKAITSDTHIRKLWAEGTKGGTDRSRNDAALAAALGDRGFEDPDIEAALRAYPRGQVFDTQDARAVGRLLGIAAKARERARKKAPTLTDTGNSSRLVNLHGDRLHYIAKWDKWLCWDGGVWQVDDGAVRVRELAKDVGAEIKREAAEIEDGDKAKRTFRFGLESLSSGRIGSMVNLARGIDGIPLAHEQLDTQPYLFGVENGVVDLHTGDLRDADPADLMSMQAPTRYDPGARPPRFEQAMEEWFPDPEVRSYVQRVVGAALVGAQRDHVFVIHYGGGGNGKGTFMRALRHALGRYCVVIHLSLIEQVKFKEHDTEKAHLFRARIAIASETERRIKLAEASVKNLTGGDPIHARRMREDPWEFDPTHSLWLQTNYLPEISGRDTGIWRRIRVVKWVSTFEGTKVDPDLDAKLDAEAPGILRWAVAGCLMWQRDGLAEPEAILRDTLEYRQSEDVLSRFADDVGLQFGRGLTVPVAEVQRMLREWAEEEGVKAPTKELAGWMKERGARQKQAWERTEGGTSKQVRRWMRAGVVTSVTSNPSSIATRAREDGNMADASHASQEADEDAELELEYERLRAGEDAA